MPECFVGFFGLNRSLRWTGESIERHIVGPLVAAGLTPVLAAHFNRPETFHSPRSGEFHIPFNTDGADQLAFDPLWIEPQRDSDIEAELAVALGVPLKYEADPDGTVRRNVLYQLHSLSRLGALLDQTGPERFELFCLLRADLLYLDPIPVKEIRAAIAGGVDIVTANWQQWSGLNDRFTFCSRRGAAVYLNRRRFVGELCAASGTFHAESLLRLAVERSGLRQSLTGMRAKRVRANGVAVDENFSPPAPKAAVPPPPLPPMPFPVDKVFARAVEHHGSGQLQQARDLYEAILARESRHFGAICRLGVVHLQMQNFEAAADQFRLAVGIDGKSADAHHYLGFALTGLDRSDEAVRSYRSALAARPAFPEAHNNLGHALQRLGRLDEAVASFEAALALRPAYAEARNNIGNALHAGGDPEQAIPHYRAAIALKADYAEAHFNLANALHELGLVPESLAEVEQALAIRPLYAEAWVSKAIRLRELGRTEEAAASYQKALAIRPHDGDAHIGLAETLAGLDRQEEAIRHFDLAIQFRRGDISVLNRRGAVLALFGRYAEACGTLDYALSFDPDNAAAIDTLMQVASSVCDWKRTTPLETRLAACVEAGRVVDPFALLAHSAEPALHLKAAALFGASVMPARAKPLWSGHVWRNDRIRLAYVATGFHRHPAAYLSVELFELHDRARFEVLGYSLGPDDGSDIRARVIAAFDEFHDVRTLSDSEIARRIHDRHVDIVIDRTGYARLARPGIFARRPAPIQVNYLGFPGTLGSRAYDYIIADPTVLPMDQQTFYAEKIVHLPDCYQSNDSKRPTASAMPTRRALGLPEAGFVFCCFNNLSKISPTLFSIWMRLLAAVEGSVLWLLCEDPVAKANLRREAAARAIDPDRIVFAGRLPLADHLARHRQADLCLDTLPYNAHTTASDALWAGLPMVTCQGTTFAGRVGASLLKAVGLPELITQNLADYERLALDLARDPVRLRELRERLSRQRLSAPLFDSRRYCRNIEAAYETMWQRWQNGVPPESFAVAGD